MKPPATRDHTSFELKLLLRRRLADGVRPDGLLDFFAGEGRLFLAHAGRFRRARAVERDPGRAGRLRDRLAAAGLHHAEVITGDNLSLVPCLLEGMRPTFLDFDAFGNPHPLIRQVFRALAVKRRTAVAVTDGSRIALARSGRLCLANWQAREGRPGTASAHPLLRSEHELLVRAFWQDLARERGFTVTDFFGAWPRGRRIFYYGLWIEPAQ